jgi:hypothetical protein
MIEQFMAVIGMAGAFVVTGTYLAHEMEKLPSRSVLYYVLNAVGAVLILVSVAARYDSGDIGGILVEALWLGVSLIGLAKALRRRGRLPGGGAGDVPV